MQIEDVKVNDLTVGDLLRVYDVEKDKGFNLLLICDFSDRDGYRYKLINIENSTIFEGYKTIGSIITGEYLNTTNADYKILQIINGNRLQLRIL